MKKGFLNDTVSAIIAQHGWRNMDDLTLVFPSQRAGLVFKDLLKQHHKEQKGGAILLPNITTLPDLFESLCPMSPVEELEAVFRLYKIYETTTKEFYDAERGQFEAKNPGKKYDMVKPFNLDVFYSWGRQLLSDFNNIDSSDAGKTPDSVHKFFDNAIQAKKLEGLEIDYEVRERLHTLLHEGESEASQDDAIRKKYEAIWHCMEAIYNQFHAELAQDDKVTTGMQKRWVIDHWDEVKEQCAEQQYIFIGFNYLLPVEKELFALIQGEDENKDENKHTLFYWDYVKDFATNRNAYKFIEQNIQQFPNAAEPTAWEKKQVDIVAASSANAQAQFVNPWLQEHYTAKGQRTAVVICDEQMLEPVIYALPALTVEDDPAAVNINITKGFPISSTQIYSDVIAYLSDKKNDCHEGETYTDVVQRVLDYVVTIADKRYSGYVSVQKEKQKEQGKTADASWQRLLIEESIYQVQLQLNQLHTMLSNPAYSGLVNSLTLLRSIVRRVMESVSLPFHGEPITDIQVMGVLETRALDFDNLLLLNVEEGIVPRKESDSSFIPYYLRKVFRMQTREEAASVYAYNFFRLLNRAEHITAVFSNAQTSMGAKSMSRFLMQIMTSSEFDTARFVLQESTNLPAPTEVEPNRSMLSKLERHEDGYLYYKKGECHKYNKDENGETKNEEKNQQFTLSPSALNTYIACPRWFYLQYVEGLRSQDQSHAIFEANEIGTFVHKVMELIYRNEFGCSQKDTLPITKDAVTIDADKLAALEKNEDRLTEILNNAYDEINENIQQRNKTAPSAKQKENEEQPIEIPQSTMVYHYKEHPAENLVILKLVHKILKHDLEDARTQELKIVALEHKGYYDIEIENADPTLCGKIQVGGVIDRLDICGETLRIVDYKTGGYSKDKLNVLLSDKNGEIPLVTNPKQHYVLQTLIYSEAVATRGIFTLPLQPNLFFTQSNLSHTAVTLDGQPIADYNTLRDDSDTQKGIPTLISEKIRSILSTDEFPQCDDGKCKSYCPFLDICSREPEFTPQN